MKKLLSLVLVMFCLVTVGLPTEAKKQTKNEKMAAEYVTELDDGIYDALKENEEINNLVKNYEVTYKDMGYSVYKFTVTLRLTDKTKIECVWITDLNSKYDTIEYYVMNGERVTQEDVEKAYPAFKEDK